jgi:hypothetical protein
MAKIKPQMVDNFQHRQAAFNWLKENGHSISKGAFYGHFKDSRISLNSDGSVSRLDVKRYAQSLDRSTLATPGYVVQKEGLEIRKLTLAVEKAEKEARKDDDRWLYRDDAYAQMAALLGTLVDSIEHHFLVGINEIVDSVDGNLSLKEQGFMVCEEILGRARNEVFSLGQINRVLVKSAL